MSTNDYKSMSNEKIDELFHRDPNNEDIFEEYHSRLDWKAQPEFSSPEEEEKFWEELIRSKTA